MQSTPEISNRSLSAIVLAGGQSSRMGRDKALIEISGVPLLRRVCEAALGCTDQVYVVTAWGDRYLAIVPPSCHLIADLQQGPLVGFAQGLIPIQTDWVLLLACDLPRLRGEDLQFCMAALRNGFTNRDRPVAPQSKRLGTALWILSPHLFTELADVYRARRTIVSSLVSQPIGSRIAVRKPRNFI